MSATGGAFPVGAPSPPSAPAAVFGTRKPPARSGHALSGRRIPAAVAARMADRRVSARGRRGRAAAANPPASLSALLVPFPRWWCARPSVPPLALGPARREHFHTPGSAVPAVPASGGRMWRSAPRGRRSYFGVAAGGPSTVWAAPLGPGSEERKRWIRQQDGDDDRSGETDLYQRRRGLLARICSSQRHEPPRDRGHLLDRPSLPPERPRMSAPIGSNFRSGRITGPAGMGPAPQNGSRRCEGPWPGRAGPRDPPRPTPWRQAISRACSCPSSR